MPAACPITTAVVDLTPHHPSPMGGFSGPERLSHSTEGRLEANIIAFGDAGQAIVLVSLDTLFVGAEVRDHVISIAAKRFGVGPERVLVLASHTHFAPMLDTAKPKLGQVDSEESLRWVVRVAKSVNLAPTDLAVAVREGCGRSDAAVNRRLRWRLPSLVRLAGKTDGDIYMCDNPAGPRDARLRIWVWLSSDQKPLGALWSFACHPVNFPEPNTASPDYIGRVREALRRRLGHQLPVVFAPGCMGDVWPRSSPRWRSWKRAHQIAIYGPAPTPWDLSAWEQWAGNLAQEALNLDARGVVKDLEETLAAHMLRQEVGAIFEGASPVREFTAKAVAVPGIGRIVALSCEPVADVAGIFARSEEDLILGYEGDVFGYLPTQSMVHAGGYEPRLSHKAFGLKGTFRSDLDATIRRWATLLQV